MSKAPVRRVKRDSSLGDRISDDEHNRRKISYQLVEKERQKKIAALNGLRKNQLGILQELLLNQRNVKHLKTRPTSAKSLQSQFETVNRSIYSSHQDEEPRVRKTRSQSRPRTANNELDRNVKTLLNRLSSELHNLETMTGFKSNKIDPSSHSSSTVLANALIGLIGHVRHCASRSQEINHLKDRLSIMMRSQLDFQEKIETQVATLQTMMQTICQLVNNEIISKKKTSLELVETQQQNWLNNAQRPYIVEKDTANAMDELLMFTRRMNNDTPSELNLYQSSANNRHSAIIETLEASKRLTSSNSTNDQYHNADQPLRLSMISPIEMPLVEADDKPETGSISTTLPTSSATETILEKILQERLRLVQQMSELNKQHEMTQEELAHLEANTIKS